MTNAIEVRALHKSSGLYSSERSWVRRRDIA
jgi:hypothetical protein